MEFVRIESLFCKESERTVEQLSGLYDNKSLLMKKIGMVSHGILDNESIIQGKNILFKPNWVQHNIRESDEICLRTHDNFLLAAIEIVLINKPAKVTIGDAPIQGCKWDKLHNRTNFYEKIRLLSIKFNVPIFIKDFRRVTFETSLNNPVKERRPLSEYIIFDLGSNSSLEPISSSNSRFRVTGYSPERLLDVHKKGTHKYCLTKEIFDADVVISLPKVKTHQKAGITCALKNLVGINGDKDFLPHHRLGGTGFGGDCYPGKSYLRLWAEKSSDRANGVQGKRLYWLWTFTASFLWKLSLAKKDQNQTAGWYGNDTTWRMVMDLNKIAIYGKSDGTISSKPQRSIYSLCDGIIGGQGDGPLSPDPLPLGIISFTNRSHANDICMAKLMKLDFSIIPMLADASNQISKSNIVYYFNGEEVKLNELENHSIKTNPPPGWVDYFNKNDRKVFLRK